ncbi:MAG TPA: tetratricopeptide repeat protein [Opitutaceae bacterium]|nr:tetratricopeptide repeat protein [Opitutaceae bacterium]
MSVSLPSAPPDPPARRTILGLGAVLALAALAAYHNTFGVPFLFDDAPSIQDNPTIQHLGRIRDLLLPGAGYGITISGRPVLNLSLALSYALSGYEVWGYHLVNLLIHVLAGLTLFGVVRRALVLGRVPALRPQALPAAFAVALLWTLHPLQTEAVTYIIQRTESLMGLFYLLTFYGLLRAAEAPAARRWPVLTVTACLLGMGTKEVMATAPVLLFLFDRTFVAGSFAEAWRRRRGLFLALAATWLPLLGLVASTGWNRGHTAGFNVGISPWAYWFTQFEAVVRYLKLSVWPHPQIFEYGTFWMKLGDAAPYALIVVPLAAATLVALWRRPVAGFLGAWFFGILAPTSVIPGTIQMIVEHRMYLPLAAGLALLVGGAAARWGRAGLAACLALAVAAGALTEQRNRVYASDLSLWADTVARSPGSAIAQSGLGTALFVRGRMREALHHYQVSAAIDPTGAQIHFNLGLALAQLNHLPEAAAQFQQSFRINPLQYLAHYQLGMVWLRMGRTADALAQFQETLHTVPTMSDAQFECGAALVKLGRPAEAVPYDREALRLDPGSVDAECNLGVALSQLHQTAEAVQCFERALRRDPNRAEAHFNLGLALEQIGQPGPAMEQYAAAVRLDPAYVGAQLNLGIALAQAGNLAGAQVHLARAVELAPDYPATHCNLGIVLAQAGRWTDAVAQYAEALRLNPNYAEAHYNLGNALLALRRLPEARAQFEAALRLNPGFDAAREVLERLRPYPDTP